jgi:hypothetical protein
MEQLILLLVLGGLYALQAWWKKKAEKEQAEPPPPWPGQQPQQQPGPAQPQRPAQTPAARWEEELRRLLEGESPKPAPPPVAPSPPPLPPKMPRKPVVSKPVVVVDRDMETGLPVQMPTLQHSAQAFLRASQLESKVAEQMRRVEEQVTRHKKVETRRGVSPEIRQAIGLVRNRQSQRAAIIAGIVLGPPKAMEG